MKTFPERLLRSLIFFAGAGTLMSFVVWSDGMGGPWLPGVMLVACWAIPLLFAWQIRTNGFDPILKLVATESGLEAHDRAGHARFIAWATVQALLQVEGFRYKAWAILNEGPPLRWFGELEGLDDLKALASEKTSLSWEIADRLPEA